MGSLAVGFTSRKISIAELEKKIEKLEEKYMDEAIDQSTYRKWLRKYREQIAVLKNGLDMAKRIKKNNPIDRLKALLPEVRNLRGLYQMATLEEQHDY